MKTRTILFLTAPLVVAGTVAVGAQTLRPDLVERATTSVTAPVKAHFRGFGRGFRSAGVAMKLFGEVDADGNGKVTQAELDTFRQTQVTKADTSGDGAVDLAEFEVIFRERTRPFMVDAFQMLDDDGDGKVTDAELSERFGAVVARFDRNGDGALSLEDRRRGGRRGRHRDR